MACHQICAMPFLAAMLISNRLEHEEQLSIKYFALFAHFHRQKFKCIRNIFWNYKILEMFPLLWYEVYTIRLLFWMVDISTLWSYHLHILIKHWKRLYYKKFHALSDIWNKQITNSCVKYFSYTWWQLSFFSDICRLANDFLSCIWNVVLCNQFVYVDCHTRGCFEVWYVQ